MEQESKQATVEETRNKLKNGVEELKKAYAAVSSPPAEVRSTNTDLLVTNILFSFMIVRG